MAPRPPKQEQEQAGESVTEVAPGVLRAQLPIDMPGLGHVNCYVLEDERGAAIVDPGLAGSVSRRALKSRLAAAGIPLRRVHTVIVTHSHPDHFGAAGWVRHETGADIVTHRRFRLMWDPSEPPDVDVEDAVAGFDPNGDVDGSGGGHLGGIGGGRVDGGVDGGIDGDAMMAELALRSRPRMPWDPAPWGGSGMTIPFRRRARLRLSARFPRLLRLPVPSVRLDDAGPIRLARRDWVAMHTPGHTEDHLCLFDPTDGVMLSGDHVLPTITPHIGGFGPYRDPLACFFRLARQGCRPRTGHQHLPAGAWSPVHQLDGQGRRHQAPPPRAPRDVAIGVRGHRPAGVGERAVESPVLGPRPRRDG